MDTHAVTSDPLASVSDFAVIDEVVRGNREMFEVLVRRHNQRLFRVGMACLKQADRVEDAMQNTYLKAYLHLRRFRRTAAFSTWLTRIMINECRMVLRQSGASREDRWAEVHTNIPDPDLAPAGQALTLNEMKTVLEEAIAGLAPKYRKVYVLRDVQQMTTAETAACLGISNESVKVSLHRARQQLKTRLLKSAVAPELFEFRAPLCNRLTARIMSAVLEISGRPA